MANLQYATGHQPWWPTGEQEALCSSYTSQHRPPPT